MTATLIQHPTVLASRKLLEPAVRQFLVLDDYVIFAEALVCRLNAEPGVHAAAATTVELARRALSECRFDVLMLDLDLDGHDGLRFAGEAFSEHPDMRIVVVTVGEDHSQVMRAVQAGVSGWVPKSEPIEHLLAVLYGALRGETWIPPKLLTGVLAELKSTQRDRAEHDAVLAKLTRREREILGLLATGMNLDAIANKLYLSRNTVRTHIQNTLGKLNVHSTVAAVAAARRAGLCWPNPPQLEATGRVGHGC
jgi:DNA-binding NarL/FixJ family response regulator